MLIFDEADAIGQTLARILGMNMNTKDITSTAVVCGSCEQPNAAESKFCKGCGHTLYEPCAKCLQPALLDQRFCVGCGADLADVVAKRQRQYEEKLSSAVAAAKDFEFETSLGLLETVGSVNDYRFRATAESARTATERVKTLRDKTLAATQAKVDQALARHKAGNLSDVVKLLKDIPSKLLDDATQRIYAESAGALEQLKSLEEEFAEASRVRNWPLAGELVHQLQEALPEDRRYQKTAEKIGEKLISKAEALFAKQKYSAASSYLGAIPRRCHSSKTEALDATISSALWIQSVIQTEPFASPTLGRLAVRFSKLVPDDPSGPTWVKEISETLKTGKRYPHNHLPGWKGRNQAWTGGQFQLYTRPRKIEYDESNEVIRTRLGRFNVAMGLALQGLGKARVSDDLSSQKKKKKRFGRKQSQPCWGIDVGTSSVKAVRMEEVGDKLLLTDFFYHELEPNAPGIGGMQNSYDQIQPAIDQLTNDFDLENCSVWVNLPGSDVTTRFVRMPPVDDKKAAELAAAELKNRIPVPADELAVTQTIGAYDKESSHGRPLVFSAARLNIIEKRMELFEQTGLKVDGMQTDPNAIVNLMAWEFADTLAPPEPESSEPEIDKKKKWGKKDVKAVARFDEKTPAVCWIDAGAASTTMIYVSGETHWFWTVEQGGDNLTSALARSTKKTQDESETLKIQPEKLEQPAQHFAAVDAKLAEMRSRFKKIAEDALKQNDRFDPIKTYVSGGAALTLGWNRKLLGSEDPSRTQ